MEPRNSVLTAEVSSDSKLTALTSSALPQAWGDGLPSGILTGTEILRSVAVTHHIPRVIKVSLRKACGAAGPTWAHKRGALKKRRLQLGCRGFPSIDGHPSHRKAWVKPAPFGDQVCWASLRGALSGAQAHRMGIKEWGAACERGAHLLSPCISLVSFIWLEFIILIIVLSVHGKENLRI